MKLINYALTTTVKEIEREEEVLKRKVEKYATELNR